MEITKEESQELIDELIGELARKYGNNVRLQVLQIMSLAKNLYSAENRHYIPVPDWNIYHDYPTVSGLRNLIARAKENGFEKCIYRKGKRVFIKEWMFFAWFENKQEEINEQTRERKNI